MFRDLSISISTAPYLFCDNVSAIAIARNPVLHARTKHIEVDFHFVRDLVTRKLLNLRYLCTEDQLADLFTKGLSTQRFHTLKTKLSVLQNPLQLEGGCQTAQLDSSASMPDCRHPATNNRN